MSCNSAILHSVMGRCTLLPYFTMRPTTLLGIMQFWLRYQHGRHILAYLITLYIRHGTLVTSETCCKLVFKSDIMAAVCWCSFRPVAFVVFVLLFSADQTHTLIKYSWAVILPYFTQSWADARCWTQCIECFHMIPLVWASVNVSPSTASLGKTSWMHMDSVQICSNSNVCRTFHKCARNASILCAMVLKIACTMWPTTLLGIMQFWLRNQHGRHILAYLITLYIRHTGYLGNLL